MIENFFELDNVLLLLPRDVNCLRRLEHSMSLKSSFMHGKQLNIFLNALWYRAYTKKEEPIRSSEKLIYLYFTRIHCKLRK